MKHTRRRLGMANAGATVGGIPKAELRRIQHL
jgi:hypothetical protein